MEKSQLPTRTGLADQPRFRVAPHHRILRRVALLADKYSRELSAPKTANTFSHCAIIIS